MCKTEPQIIETPTPRVPDDYICAAVLLEDLKIEIAERTISLTEAKTVFEGMTGRSWDVEVLPFEHLCFLV